MATNTLSEQTLLSQHTGVTQLD